MEGWLRYHYDSFERIVLCEGAARNYPREAVTAEGLSSDRTAEMVYDFPDPEHKIELIQHGWAGPAASLSAAVPAKMELRNVYAERLGDGYVYTLDIDEFLHPEYVPQLNALMDEFAEAEACALPFLHLWQDREHFITGGFAEFSHYRLYRWREGGRYTLTHNWPSGPDGRLMIDNGFESRLLVEDGCLAAPAIVHYGFCERKSSTAEKNDYYILRGENVTRPEISGFRNAALRGLVPEGCTLYEYAGFLPLEDATEFEAARREGLRSSHPHSGEAWRMR